MVVVLLEAELVTEPELVAETKLLLPLADEEEAPAVTVTVAGAVEVSLAQISLAMFSALVRSAALHWELRQSPARAWTWACFSLRQRQSVSVREQPVSGAAL